MLQKKWREETPQHVYGDFAFVAWKRWSRRTVAATDHLGNFPLFYCRAGGRILFASQLGALLACPAVRASLDPQALGRMAAGESVQGRTMFEGIHVLPGGQLLIHHDEMVRTEQWWRPDTTPREVHAHTRDYVEEARALFDSAVASRLRARGGVIATMSGGLDSTLVAVTAARQMSTSGKVLEALTAIPQEDVAWATAVADFQPNIRQRMVSAEGMTPLDILPVAHWFCAYSGRQPRQPGVALANDLPRGPQSSPGDPLWRPRQSVDQLRGSDLCDANFIRLRRLAGAAQQTWDRVRCIGAGPRGNQHNRRRWSMDPTAHPGWAGRTAVIRARAVYTCHDRAPRGGAGRFHEPVRCGMAHLTADRKLLERLLTFPLHIFRVGNRPRGLARELGRGRLPDSVRLRRARGAHFPDQTAWFTQAADDYRKAFRSLRESTICAAFLDLASLEPLLTTLCAGGGSPAQALTVHRALDTGLFAAAIESGAVSRHVRIPSRRDTPAMTRGFTASRTYQHCGCLQPTRLIQRGAPEPSAPRGCAPHSHVARGVSAWCVCRGCLPRLSAQCVSNGRRQKIFTCANGSWRAESARCCTATLGKRMSPWISKHSCST